MQASGMCRVEHMQPVAGPASSPAATATTPARLALNPPAVAGWVAAGLAAAPAVGSTWLQWSRLHAAEATSLWLQHHSILSNTPILQLCSQRRVGAAVCLPTAGWPSHLIRDLAAQAWLAAILGEVGLLKLYQYARQVNVVRCVKLQWSVLVSCCQVGKVQQQGILDG
jgi:hypothetical protein